MDEATPVTNIIHNKVIEDSCGQYAIKLHVNDDKIDILHKSAFSSKTTGPFSTQFFLFESP